MNSGDKSSAAILSDLLFLAFSAILFQRGLYTRTQFMRARKWDLPVMVPRSRDVSEYLTSIVGQIQSIWLAQPGQNALSSVTLIIVDDDDTTIERWHFNLWHDERNGEEATSPRSDLQRLMRQIGSTVAFLPIPKGKNTFRIAVNEGMAHKDPTECPADWKIVPYRAVYKPETGEFSTVVLKDLIVQLRVVYTVE